MDKAGKSAALENLKGVFEGAGVVVVTHYTGLTVAEMTKLRGMLRKDGAHFKVVKNRLAKIALGGAGGDKAQELFQGPGQSPTRRIRCRLQKRPMSSRRKIRNSSSSAP